MRIRKGKQAFKELVTEKELEGKFTKDFQPVWFGIFLQKVR